MILLGRGEFAQSLTLAKALNKKTPDDVLLYGFIADAAIGAGRVRRCGRSGSVDVGSAARKRARAVARRRFAPCLWRCARRHGFFQPGVPADGSDPDGRTCLDVDRNGGFAAFHRRYRRRGKPCSFRAATISRATTQLLSRWRTLRRRSSTTPQRWTCFVNAIRDFPPPQAAMRWRRLWSAPARQRKPIQHTPTL